MHEVLVIGGGPAGLTAGMYCRMRKMSVLVVDAGRVGGQLVRSTGQARARLAGLPSHHRRRSGGPPLQHARELEVEMVGNHKVLDLARQEDRFEVMGHDVTTREERRWQAQSVIVAIGGGAFEPRKLKVPGEAELDEKQLTYRMPDKARVPGRTVIVVGGGDSGLESAQSAHQAGGASPCSRCSTGSPAWRPTSTSWTQMDSRGTSTRG